MTSKKDVTASLPPQSAFLRLFYQSEMLVGEFGGNAAALCADYESFFYKEGFIYFLEGTLVLAYCCSYGIGANRTPFESINDSAQNLVVYSIQTAGVDIQLIQTV